jgi:hypothetical protein
MESHEESPILRREAASLLDVWLIRDHKTVAEVCAEISSRGHLVVCHRCSDVEALIVGLLVFDDDEEAWALCGTCIGKLPVHGAVA